MRILLEHGEHQHRNRGDVAMLQVTVERLRAQWPQAQIIVLTGDADLLQRFVPHVVPREIRGGWGLLRRRAADPLDEIDLLVAVGGGYITDVDPEQAERVLRRIIDAQARDIPVVMFGQGLGPLDDPRLRLLAAQALPGVRQIALREALDGPVLLDQLGVSPDRVVVTGDDAVPLARRDPPARPGQGIGVNHRLATYLRTDPRDQGLIRGGVHAAAYHLGTVPLVPIPVSEWDDDRPGTALVTEGYGLVEHPEGRDAPPEWAMRRIDRTRVVVTSTYHLAVFALARGVPAVCLAASDYYRAKFHGLADQFGVGCTVLDLHRTHDDDVVRMLAEAIEALWEDAEALRPDLLAAADRQIAAADAAYRRARDLLRPAAVR